MTGEIGPGSSLYLPLLDLGGSIGVSSIRSGIGHLGVGCMSGYSCLYLLIIKIRWVKISQNSTS